MEASVANMRKVALDGIRSAAGVFRGPAGRSQSYIAASGKTFHLRTRQRDEQEGGWIRYWFGIQDRYWQPNEYFVLGCDLDFVLVVPTDEWIPYQNRFSISGRGSAYQARQPHIYWRDDRFELREAVRGWDQLTLDVRPFVDAFNLLQ